MQQLVPEKATKVKCCEDQGSNPGSLPSGSAALPQSYDHTALKTDRHEILILQGASLIDIFKCNALNFARRL